MLSASGVLVAGDAGGMRRGDSLLTYVKGCQTYPLMSCPKLQADRTSRN